MALLSDEIVAREPLGSARSVNVTIYTDPGCQFGFNSQRQELQLMWAYGHEAEIVRRMIGLSETSSSFEEIGLPVELVERTRERLAGQYGMPMGLEPLVRVPSTREACRAYIGARMHAPAGALALLRGMFRRAQSAQELLDERETVLGAADDAGLLRDTVEAWLADGDVEAELRSDMAAARDPLPEALALSHRLTRTDEGLRYSSSSAVFEYDGRRVVSVGFQPFAVWEIAAANVAPDVERREPPETVEEVLGWADFPLATAEVAELRGIGIDEARAELESAGATFTPSGTDGYWVA
jgi:predicted DsbA family dithiol-disulfide isomerase